MNSGSKSYLDDFSVTKHRIQLRLKFQSPRMCSHVGQDCSCRAQTNLFARGNRHLAGKKWRVVSRDTHDPS